MFFRLRRTHLHEVQSEVQSAAVHGSSEGHEMLKRNDKYHSIADDVPIPKM